MRRSASGPSAPTVVRGKSRMPRSTTTGSSPAAHACTGTERKGNCTGDQEKQERQRRRVPRNQFRRDLAARPRPRPLGGGLGQKWRATLLHGEPAHTRRSERTLGTPGQGEREDPTIGSR